MDAMTRFSRLLILAAFAALASGCPPAETQPSPTTSQLQIIRVRLIPNATQVYVTATANPILSISTDPARHELAFPKGQPVLVSLTPTGWQIGGLQFGGGVLTLSPSLDGTLSVNNAAYHGDFRFAPNDTGSFDCINDVEIDDYLKGVLARELYPSWPIEAYKAQAVVARTYALYTARTDGLTRSWDVYADTRSQVYGGISGETDK